MALVNTQVVGSYALTPAPLPPPTPDAPEVLQLQAPAGAPSPQSVITGTNLLNLPPNMATRLRSFPEEVYTLNPTDHLTKFLKVLLGDAGAGQLRKTALKARLGTVMQGSNFYELDSFYGALFGVVRNSSEQLPINPYTDVADSDTWAQIRAQDSLYRTRLDQFGKAVSLGPSAIGLSLMAEAILQTPCDIYESWKFISSPAGVWYNLEGSTWAELETSTWEELETMDSTFYNANRKVFTVVPHRAITLEETFNLRQVLNVLKPADSILLIDSNGFETRTEVALRGVYADSTYWELQEFVIPNAAYVDSYSLSSDVQPGGWQELLKPAFTQYQGESISYGGDIIGVSGYDLDDAGAVIVQQVIDSYTFLDGVTLYYPPSQAIATRFFSLAGRFVSDAINQGAIYSNDQSNSPTATADQTDVPLMTLYVDGLPMEVLADALEAPGIIQNLGIQSSDQRFWSTPPRPATDDTTEVLDIYLVANRLVNTITFSAAHYPQVINILTYNPLNATWNSIWQQKIYDSIPAVLPTSVPLQHEHPQHPSSNWDSFTISIPPTLMSELRVTLQRLPNGTPPVTATAPTSILSGYPQVITTAVPYSLGIQDFALGYQITQESDLPDQPIITTDALGSQIEYLVRQEVADGTINDGGVPWRCAPQPTADSVVNFYLDTRDGTGNAQLIDSIFMDPLYTGPHCTIYYSNTNTAELGFPSEDTDIVPPVLDQTGNMSVYNGALWFDSVNKSYLDFDNSNIQFDPDEAWWMGWSIIAQAPSGGDAVIPLIDAGCIFLEMSDNDISLSIKTDSSPIVLTVPTTWSIGQTIDIVVAYFPEDTDQFSAGIYLFYANNDPLNAEAAALVEGRIVQPMPFPIFGQRFNPGPFTDFAAASLLDTWTFPPSFRIGNTLPAESGPIDTPANFQLVGFCLKQTEMQYTDVSNFVDSLSPYTTRGGAETDNAILFFNSANVDATNALGWVGGPGDFYPLLTWTPLTREFTCSRGYMEFPPTLATFFKLEFTNLIAQPFPTLLPITKTAQTHQGLGPSVAQEVYQPPQNNPGPTLPGTAEAIALASSLGFSDNPVTNGTVDPPFGTTAILPTMVQTAPDIETQTTLANAGWQYGYQEWSPGQSAPRFINTSVHVYPTTTVQQNTQVSYFVGLTTVSAWRTDFTVGNDPVIYDEVFVDDAYIATADIPQSPGDVNTIGVDSFPVYDESVVYNSSDVLVGVQFATVQSDAQQIAYDDDFGDPRIQPPYAWDNDGQPHIVGDATLYYQDNQTVLVLRNTVNPGPPAPSYDGIVDPIVYPIFEEQTIESEVIGLTPFIATYDSQPGSTSAGYLGTPPPLGGLSSANSTTALGGTVYAAVRVSTNDVLANPLALEVYDVNSKRVVATTAISVAPNQTVETYVGYVLGSVVAAGGPVTARIVQYGGAYNSWIVDRLSLFQDAIEWEFSNDGGSTWVTELNTRNNAYGVMTFPDAGKQLTWRVTMWTPNLHLHFLRVRPVYTNLVPDQPQGVIRGPNLCPFDQTPPIAQDPYFTGWSKPIPYSWYAAASEVPILPIPGQPVIGPYSEFYTRAITDSAASISDSITTRTLFANRQFSDNVGVSDSMSRSLFAQRGFTEQHTWEDWEGEQDEPGTWADLETRTWKSLESPGTVTDSFAATFLGMAPEEAEDTAEEPPSPPNQ